MRILTEHGPTPAGVVAGHVALAVSRSAERAFVRLNMISSADGGSADTGTSGALGTETTTPVYGALREPADAVLVGMSTAVAEHYHAPKTPHLRVYVIAETPDVSDAPELFASGLATLVLPEDAGPGPEGVPELRAGTGGQVDFRTVASLLAGKMVVMEGGPTLAAQMVSLGLVDEFFLTVAPRVTAGGSARVVHGPDADPTPWQLLHGFVDDEGFLFLRYVRRSTLTDRRRTARW